MSDTAQAGFDRAEDDIRLRPGFAAALGIDQQGTVRTPVRLGIRRVGIVRTDFPVSGVAIDHRIHVAGSHAEKQIGPPQHLEGPGRMPVRLGDDADTKTLGLQQSPDQSHAETWVIDVGVAGHQDDIARVPAEAFHLCPRHWQKGGNTKAFRPVFAPGKEGFGLVDAHMRFRFWKEKTP